MVSVANLYTPSPLGCSPDLWDALPVARQAAHAERTTNTVNLLYRPAKLTNALPLFVPSLVKPGCRDALPVAKNPPNKYKTLTVKRLACHPAARPRGRTFSPTFHVCKYLATLVINTWGRWVFAHQFWRGQVAGDRPTV